MTKFIKKTSILLCIIIVTLFIYEKSYRAIPNRYSYIYSYLQNKTKAKKIKCLLLGTSHSSYNINPRYLSLKSFSAACANQPVFMDYKIAYHFLLDNYTLTSLKYIVLAYDITTLSVEDFVSNSQKVNYKIYWHFDNIPKIPFYLNFKFYNPQMKNYISYLLGNYKVNYDSSGWFSSNFDTIDVSKITEKLIKKRIDEISLSSVKSVEELNISKSYLFKLAELCKKKHINLILMNSPKTKYFLSHRHKDDVIYMDSLAGCLSIKYNNVFYANWAEDSVFTINNFSDLDHLNVSGAKKLSYKLNKLIEYLDKK